jgi:hypothetical protein
MKELYYVYSTSMSPCNYGVFELMKMGDLGVVCTLLSELNTSSVCQEEMLISGDTFALRVSHRVPRRA